MRRLPIYLLLDTSSAMDGEPLEKVKNGVETIISTLNTDPYALETVYVSVITFGGSAIQAVPLTELEHFQLPQIKAEGNKLLDEALLLLSEKIDSEIVKTTSNSKGDWYPIIFIMTDGVISSNFDKGLEALRLCKLKTVVVCTIEKNVEMDILKNISENIISLETIDELRLRSFMKWIDQPIVERRYEEIITSATQNSDPYHQHRSNEYQTRSRDNNTEPKRKMFAAPFSFGGKIGTKEYILSFAITYVTLTILLIFSTKLNHNLIPIVLLLYWFFVSQGTKRCNDFGCSGWRQFFPFFCCILMYVEKTEDIESTKEECISTFSFKGRTSRKEYLFSFLWLWPKANPIWFIVGYGLLGWCGLLLIPIYIILSQPFIEYANGLFGTVAIGMCVLDIIISLSLTILFFFANGTKRCHDLGKSGWWQFIPLYFFVMMFKKGENGTNKFGVEP